MKTSIEWTIREEKDGTIIPGYTFNPYWGCTHASGAVDPNTGVADPSSPACDNCYAEAWANFTGHPGIWTEGGRRRFFGDAHWNHVREWQAEAAKLNQQRLVFCGSMCDIGERREDLVEHQQRTFELVEETKNLVWLFLTKRPEGLREIVPWKKDWPDNAWFGVTVESRPYLWRIEEALKANAACHFVSYEPALSEVDFRPYLGAQRGKVQWLIFGTESGTKARVVPHDRAASVIKQCRETGAKPFIKQLDSALLQLGRRGKAYKALAGFPEPLRIREWPALLG